MNRRYFLSRTSRLLLGAAGVGAFAGTIAPRARAANELHLLTWEGYAEDTWIRPFEEQHGVTVTRTYVGSNDEYMAKLAAGGVEYDVVVIVSSLAQPAIRAGFVQPLDRNLIPNFEQLFPTFQSVSFTRQDQQIYGVPTFWGTEPVTFNAEAVDPAKYADIYGVLFDEQFKGRLSMWDDVSTIGEVANHLGFDNIWTLTDQQLAVVKDRMIAQKPLIRKYWSTPGEVIELFLSREIVASNSWNYITQALVNEDFPASELNPTPPIGWVDSHFLVRRSPSPELAHAFINHIIGAEVQARIGEATGYSITNPLSKTHMDPAVWERLYMDEGPQMLSTMKFWEEIPRRDKYLEVWNEIKAAPAQ